MVSTKVFVGLFCAVTCGCASGSTTTAVGEPLLPTETPVAAEAARVVDSNYFVDVEFAKGSDVVDEFAASTILSLLKRASAQGPVKDVKLIVWADEEYPSARTKKLAKKQRKLASARGSSLTTYIRSVDAKLQVESHNMAQRPNAVARWFDTRDAAFKRMLVEAGLPTTAESEPVIGRASHALIFVTLK